MREGLQALFSLFFKLFFALNNGVFLGGTLGGVWGWAIPAGLIPVLAVYTPAMPTGKVCTMRETLKRGAPAGS